MRRKAAVRKSNPVETEGARRRASRQAQQQVALNLKLNGFTYDQIAARMGLKSTGTARSMAQSAKKRGG